MLIRFKFHSKETSLSIFYNLAKKMRVIINHQFTPEKAGKCAEDLIVNLTEKFKDEISDFSHEKGGNIIRFSLKARGMKFNGIITIDENTVTIESKLPIAVRMFQGILEKKIYENADKELAKCK
jgi:hypothetical protein